MRKKLTIFATLLVALAFGFGLKALGWTSSDPATLEDGTYYIYNVGQEKFLHQGNSWGTHAMLYPHAYACKVVKNGDGTFKIQPLDGNKWLGDNGYMDNGTPVSITATAVEGGYKLTAGGKVLSLDGNDVNWLDNADGANATWQILTATELKSGFASVTAAQPVDATFMVKGPRLLRENNEWVNSWINDPATGNKVDYDGNTFSSCVEVWNNTVSTTQEVNLVKGAYKLTVDGFYRYGDKDPAIAAHNDGTEVLNAYLMAGEAKTPLMSICDGKGITDLNTVVNDQGAAGRALRDGMYVNNLYFRVEADGPVTIGVKKDVTQEHDWTVFHNFTLTYYGPDASVEDIIPHPADLTVLKEACAAARAKLGFEAGEYAPYNNVASMEALIEAEAMLEVEQFDQAAVNAKAEAINALAWVANEARVDAVYNGNFHNSVNDSYADGWKSSNKNMGGPVTARAFVLTEGMTNYAQLAALQPEEGTRAALFIRFDGNNSDGGTQYVYGQGTNTARWGAVPTPYCMPLKAGVRYDFNADVAAWGGGAVGKTVKMYVVDADNKEVGSMSVKTESDASQVGGVAKHVAFEFTPTVDGNCSVYVQNPGAVKGPNYLVSNFSILPGKQDQTITWEQDFAGVKDGSVVELNATASSELPVAYEFEDAEAAASIATLEGNKLTFIAEGTVVVKATQEGNDDWKAAEPVSKTITAGANITSLAQLAEIDKTKPFYVGCELTVVYMSEFGSGWVYDGESFVMLGVANTEGLVPGAIIAAGWEATYTDDPGVLMPASDGALAVVADRTNDVPAPVEALSADLAANTYVRVVAALAKVDDYTYTATTDDGKVITINDMLGVVAGEFDKFDMLGFVYKPASLTPPAEDEEDTPALAEAEAILTVIPVSAVEYVPLAEVPADGYYWIKNVETEQYLIHNGSWGTLTTLGEYGIPVKVATVDGVTTLAYADYNPAHDNWFLFKNGANNDEGVQDVYSDNMMGGDNNSHHWNIVPATPTSLYIQNAHNGAYMFAKDNNGVYSAATSVAQPANCNWQFVPAAGVAEFLAAKRDAQVAALAAKAGVEAAAEADFEGQFTYVVDVTPVITLPASRGEAFQPGGGEPVLDNGKEVMNFSIVAPKAGVYKIVVPAMWRNGQNSVTETLANADIDYANTVIYTDDFKGVVLGQSTGASATNYDFPTKEQGNNMPIALTIKGQTVYVPNSEDGFQAWVENGHYGNVVYAYAAEDGATITIKARANSGRNWDGQWFVQNAPLTKVYLLSQEEYVVTVKADNIAALNTIDEEFAQNVELTLNNAKVTYYAENVNTYFIEDATGATRLTGFNDEYEHAIEGIAQGKAITGTVTGMYNEGEFGCLASKVNVTASEDVDVTLGATMTVAEAKEAANANKLVTFVASDDLTISVEEGMVMIAAGEDMLIVADPFYSLSEGYEYPAVVKQVTGIIYSQGMVMLAPRSEADIVAGEADGINGINADDANATFFNLQGVQVKNPQPGQTYIVVKNGRAYKALVK